MKSFSSFIVACLEYATVFTICFILPAVIASVVMFDSSVYMACIKEPAYSATMAFVAFFATVGYGIYKEEHGE
jgi:hypothetical protein